MVMPAPALKKRFGRSEPSRNVMPLRGAVPAGTSRETSLRPMAAMTFAD
jgi:hypothetical protein